MKLRIALVCLAVAMLAPMTRAGETKPFEFKDGDRVAFVGNTFVEREQNANYIEAAIVSRFADRNITFRNLGYSADTTTGEARGLCSGWSQFEGPDKAFERLRKLVAEYKPTILLINYGMTESFQGPDGLAEFTANYNKMLDALSAAAGTSPRLILMTPNFHEDLGKPLPDPSAHNKNLRLYSDAIGQIASGRSATFIDLMKLTEEAAKLPPGAPLTWNGIHLTAYGYWRVALAIEQALGYSARTVELKVGADGKAAATETMLPICDPPAESPKSVLDGSVVVAGAARVAKVGGLKPGTYQLKAGDEVLAKASADEFAKGVPIKSGPAEKQADALRKLIVAKNFDYFAYQRPDNDSYILAFRKKEQGRNAVEIPQFLPFVEEKERQIAELRVPKTVTYTFEAVK